MPPPFDPIPNTVDLLDPADRLHPLNAGKVAWYLGLDGSAAGPTARDLMGANTGTLVGGASWGPATRPGASAEIRLDGATGYVECGASPAFDLVGEIAVAAWARIDSSTINGMILVSKDGSTGGRSYTLDASEGVFRFYIGGGAAGIVYGTTTLVLGRWYHVVGTRDAAGTVSVYLDGVADAVPVSGTSVPISTVGLRLGARPYVSFEGYLDGALDDCLVMGRCPSPSEVAALYDLSRRGYPDGLSRLALAPSSAAFRPYLLARQPTIGSGIY